MDATAWIMIAILSLIVIFGIVFMFVIKRKKEHEPDYYTFFIMGIM